jgi:glycosyltransferase involved in cell wall biosynthesis
MDVFALPSHREGFPRAPMEAAASGLAAVVTDIRGCRQCVEHGRTGYLVPLFDHVALAASLGALLEDPARRVEFGAAALVKARREFDERVYFERIASRYRILLAERGRVGRASGTERA